MNIKTLQRIYSDLKPEEKDKFHEVVSDDFIKRIEETIGYEEKPEIRPLGDFYEEAVRTMRTKGRMTGLSTGLPSLDDINGGFDKQELIIITGETGIGKTNLAMHALFNMAKQGHPVLFFTLEMSTNEVVQRFININGGEPDIAAWPIFFYSGKKEVGRDLLRAAIKHAVEEHGIECVLIDHLHYFSKKAENNREEIEIICREIKMMAREYDLPIILIAHTRRLQANQSRPYLSDIKDTSSIAQDADQVIIVWRNTNSTDAYEKFTLHFDVAKNRLKGKCDVAKLRIDKSHRLIDEKKPLMTEAANLFV